MPNDIKIKRYESLILQTINKAISTEVNNDYAKQARATYCKLSKDLSICKVYVDTLSHSNKSKVIDNLNRISGFFRSKVCEVLDIYKTPKILFEIDKSIEYAENIDKIIKSINK